MSERYSDPRKWGYRILDALQQSVLVLPIPRRWMLRAMGVHVGRRAYIVHGVHVGSTKVRFGDRTYCNTGCFFDGTGEVLIEDDVKFAAHVRVLTADREISPTLVRMSAELKPGPVRIGRGTWLGMGAMVMPNVVIGEGCVIAAGAVVTRSTEPHGVYAGAPAKRIRDLPVPTA